MQTATNHEPPMHGLDDDTLMARVDSGDVEQALAILKKRYGARVLTFVHAIVRDRHLAEDVWQEVLAKLFLKSHLYLAGTNFQAWLFEIARNQALTALRKKRRSPQAVGGGDPWHDPEADGESTVCDGGDHPDRRLEEAELWAAFEDAVAALPERYRRVFELCVRGGMQYRDAAAELGVPSGTIAIRIMRARQRLFRELGRHVGRLRQPPACLQPTFSRRGAPKRPPASGVGTRVRCA